jgi:hypothetical protein
MHQRADITTPGGRILAQLVVIAVLTVPVTLWFAWWEAAPRGARPASACSACGSTVVDPVTAPLGAHSRNRMSPS